jgi:probable F420-dependent oxidoreductase
MSASPPPLPPSARPFRFGLSIGDTPSRAAWRERARTAEALGFDTFLVADHLDELVPPLTALCTAAEATTTLRVGTFVVNNDFRHPALLAKDAATVGLLTDGRFELGLGAGHMKSEYDQVGIRFDPAATRVARLGEAVPIVRGLLAGETVTFTGDHYRLDGHRCHPAPVAVPILVGGNGGRVLTIAAEHADIVGFSGFSQVEGTSDVRLSHFTAAGLADRVALVRARAGPRFDTLELNCLIQFVLVTGDRRGAAEQLRERSPALTVEDILDSPFLLIGTHDQMAEALRERRERFGISYWVVFEKRPGSDQTIETLGPVIERLR